MRIRNPRPPRDFRLFTVKQIARLPWMLLCAHLSEIEQDCERKYADEEPIEVHASHGSYMEEYQRRRSKLRKGAILVEDDENETLPF